MEHARVAYQHARLIPASILDGYHGKAGMDRANVICEQATTFLSKPDHASAFIQTVIDHLEGKNYDRIGQRVRVNAHSFDTFLLAALQQQIISEPPRVTALNNAIAAYHEKVTGRALPGSNLTIDTTNNQASREASKAQLLAVLKELIKPASVVNHAVMQARI